MRHTKITDGERAAAQLGDNISAGAFTVTKILVMLGVQ
jgi:hypothetical protein